MGNRLSYRNSFVILILFGIIVWATYYFCHIEYDEIFANARKYIAFKKHIIALQILEKRAHQGRAEVRDYLALGFLYNFLGKADKAEKAFLDAEKLAPGDLEIFRLRAHCYQDSGDYSKALKYYQHAISIDPKDHEPRCNRGYLLLIIGRLEEAKKDLLIAVKAPPPCPGAWLSLARAYHRQGNIEKAKEAYREVVSLEGISATLIRLGQVLQAEDNEDDISMERQAALELWNRIFPGDERLLEKK